MTERDYDKLKQIEEAIQAFNSKWLYESSLTLYKALDYQSNKTDRLSPATFDGFLEGFGLGKNDINKEKALASHWKQVEFIFQVADSEITRVQSLFDTGEVDRKEFQSFLFFTIHLKEDSYKRSDLVKITREINLPFKMPVIVLFHYGNKLTLSIIDRRLNKKDTSKDVLEKVTLIKDIDISNPQRAHKEILKDLSLNELYKKFEFHSFVKLHEAWKATLNISELNKKFYKELAYWYFWALQEVDFPADELKDEKTRNPVNVIRLITRLIFVWFLKEKNLVPDELFNKRKLDKILDYKDKTGSTYYKAILQNLFFATLNTEMNKDVKDKNKISRTFVNRNTGVPHYFRYSKLIKDQEKFANWMDNIPFLNGGLFECLDKRSKDKDIYIDGFTQQVKNETLVTVPDYLFFSDAPRNIDLNSTFHTKGKKYEVRGLIDILSRYKFTIEENTPIEEEMALDPELLGKVFENLLASYIEETETTARKLTGSFYTPREIVNYMVDESLITYLTNCLLKEDEEKQREALNKKLHHLFSYTTEEPDFIETEKSQLIDAIDNCKILDPACGSGAFPMGILYKLVFILGKLDPNNKKWKQKQLDKVVNDRKIAERELKDEKVREATLREIDKREDDIKKAFNQNNHELDYARKLYLIENCIYGVDKQPVAIQISKLRFFIALIVDQKTENDSEPNRGIRPLPNLETKFVAADTLVSVEKPEQLTLMNQNEALQKEIRDKEADIHNVREKHFRARTPETKEKYRKLDAQYRDELASLLERDGFPKTATKQLAGWNPYDQNKWAEFFDPLWMFEINDGFDIVIGNPPYVVPKNLTKNEKKYFIKKYKSALYQINLYLMFMERGLSLCNKHGILSYIVPNTWLVNKTVKDFRKYFIENYSIHTIADLTSQEVFEATVLPIVIIAGKSKNNQKHILVQSQTEMGFIDKLEIDISVISDKNNYLINYQLNADNYQLIDIIENNRNPLVNISKVSFGIKLYEVGKGTPPQTKETVINKPYTHNKKINKYCRKLLEGKSIDRYKLNFGGLWLEYGEWIAAPRKKEMFEGERIVVRRIVDNKGLLCHFIEGDYCNNSLLHVVKLKTDKFQTRYITALLNSLVVGFYFLKKYAREEKTFPEIRIHELESLPIADASISAQSTISSIVDFIILCKNSEENLIKNTENYLVAGLFDQLLNGCVYQLYFGEEMKKAGVDILALVEKDLESVKKLPTEKAIEKLYAKWQEPRNEVRNRLLLMSTRCPDTIGVIEASVNA